MLWRFEPHVMDGIVAKSKQRHGRNPQDRLAERLIEQSLEFYRRRLWLECTDVDILVLELPGEPPLVASVMGSGGQEYGLNLTLGESSLAQMQAMLESGPAHEEAAESLHMVGFSVGPFGEIPGEMRRIHEAAGFAGRREILAPYFAARSPDGYGRLPTRAEMRTLLLVIDTILVAVAQGDFKPLDVTRGRVLTLRVLEPVEHPPRVEARIQVVEPSAWAPRLPEIVIPAEVASAPRTQANWCVGLSRAPGGIAGDDRVVRLVVILDRDSGQCVDVQVAMSGTTEAATALLKVMAGHGQRNWHGLPATIRFSSRLLYQQLADPLASLDIDTEYVEHDPEFEIFQQRLQGFVASELPGDGEPALPAADLVQDPGDDFGRWRSLEDQVSERLVRAFKDSERSSERVLRKYFGTAAIDDFPEPVQHMMWPAFVDWAVLAHRPTARSETIAERLLREGGLPRHAQDLLAARVAAPVSLYRIDSLVVGESVVVTDLFDGRSHTLHDRMLSQSATVGTIVALRIYPAGPFWFCAAAGPPTPPMRYFEMVQVLEREGLRLPEGLASRSERLGRLWGWSVEASRSSSMPRQLQNSDGEELRLHTLTYRVDDPVAMLAALKRRPDIDTDADDGVMRWLKPAREGWAGDQVSAAKLEQIGDELVVEVNSVERVAAVRRWLDVLPGVAFLRISESAWEQRSADAALPSLGQEPPAAEVMQAIRQMVNEAHWKWLDQPVPALGGRTPRQAAKHAASKVLVRQLILTIPDSRGPGGVAIEAPRRELLAELGLD